MKLADLAAAAKATRINDREMAELQQRIRAAEQKFAIESKAKSVDKKFLSRAYSL